MNIRSLDDISTLEQVQRIHINSLAAMLPLIDEYTFDIVPEKTFDTVKVPFQNLHVLLDIELVSTQLKESSARLSPNGVFFEINDPTGEITGVLLKETKFQGHKYCLYRVDTPSGSLDGYYDIDEAFFYSVTIESDFILPYTYLRDLIVMLYASQVLDSVCLAPGSVVQSGHPVGIKAVPQAGQRRDTYHKSAAAEPEPVEKELSPLPELPVPKGRGFRYQAKFPGQGKIYVSSIVE